MRCHYTHIKMTEITRVIISNAGENVKKLDHSSIVGGNVK